MALTIQQQVDLLFKKQFGKSDSDIDKQFFEEINSSTAVLITDVWGDPPSKIDPTASPLLAQLVSGATFTAIPGTDAGYILTGHTNLIPFNYGTVGTNGEKAAPIGYNYVLTDNGGTPIPFGVNKWVIDPESGVLIFFDGNPSTVSAGSPPKLTCYKYIGPDASAIDPAIHDDRTHDKLLTPLNNAGTIGSPYSWLPSGDTYECTGTCHIYLASGISFSFANIKCISGSVRLTFSAGLPSITLVAGDYFQGYNPSGDWRIETLYRGPRVSTFDASILAGQPIAGVLDWSHNLGQRGLMPTITNNVGDRLEPVNVTDVDIDNMKIDLRGYIVAGTWQATLTV